MANHGPYRNPSDAPLSKSDLAIAKRSRVPLVLGGGAVLAIGVIAAGSILQQRQTRAKASVEWREVEVCLFGEGAVDADLERGFRRQQLVAVAVPFDKRVEVDGAPWPAACGTKVQRFKETLGEVDSAIEKLAVALKTPVARTGEVKDLTLGVRAARTALALPEVGNAISASTLTVPLLEQSTALTTDSTILHRIGTERFANVHMPLLVDEHNQSLRLCMAVAESPVIKCKDLPRPKDSVAEGYVLGGTSDVGREPLIFAGKSGINAVYDGKDGRLIARIDSEGGHVRADGSVVLLGSDEKRSLVIVNKKPGEDAVSTKLPVKLDDGSTLALVHLLWGDLVGWSLDKSASYHLGRFLPNADSNIGYAKVGFEGAPGQYGAPMSGLDACRATSITAMANSHRLVVRSGATFSAPLEVSGTQLACGEKGAVMLGATYNQTSYASRCDSNACTTFNVGEKDLTRGYEDILKSTSVFRGWVSEKFLLVWSTARLGVRYRLAVPDQIAAAPDQILLDDWLGPSEKPNEAGKSEMRSESMMVDFRVLSRPGFALVLVATKKGIFPIYINGKGESLPAKVEVSK